MSPSLSADASAQRLRMHTYGHIAAPIADSSSPGEARRQAVRLGELAGLSEEARGRAAIVVTELATNLAKHARGGEILLRCACEQQTAGLEILAIDRGPGMADVSRCFEDGYSTAGTPGGGLGAVRRLASEFDVFSMQPAGTVIYALVTEKLQGRSIGTEFALGVVNRPAPRETQSGDTWRWAQRDGHAALLLVDGLGHGPEAAKAADAAAEAFQAAAFSPLAQLYEGVNVRMRGTRGGAVAVAHLLSKQQTVRYAGIGNIGGHLRSVAPGEKKNGQGLVSHNGIVGVQMPRVREFEHPCPRNGLLIMYSDGLQSRWNLDNYPGLGQRHPAVIAGVLYRDFTRGRDDVTVAVVRFRLE